MRKVAQCLDCGTRLSQEAWGPEICPRCSLQLALEHSPMEADIAEDPEFLPARAFPGGTLSPGRILGSRFQIPSPLGRGGMGEVWRAYDLKLRVDEALKTLRAELIQKESALKALRREARSAREAVSPGVCRVFDPVDLDGQEPVSMEYIDATTLVTVLQLRWSLKPSSCPSIHSSWPT